CAFFFFSSRRRHTRCYRDWSSDVCSSDLNSEKPNSESFGSAALIAVGNKPRIKGMWLRSPGWEFDSLSALWHEVSTANFTANEGSNSIDTNGRNGCSILRSEEHTSELQSR